MISSIAGQARASLGRSARSLAHCTVGQLAEFTLAKAFLTTSAVLSSKKVPPGSQRASSSGVRLAALSADQGDTSRRSFTASELRCRAAMWSAVSPTLSVANGSIAD